MNSSAIGLYDDARFPGRAIVSLRAHYDHFADLPADELVAFMRDVQQMSSAITSVVGASRINVAILGNRESHVHAHVIPRFPDEPRPDATIWQDPSPSTRLGEEEARQLIGVLGLELARLDRGL